MNPGCPRLSALAASALIVLLAAPRQAPAEDLTPEEAVRRALVASPTIALAREQVATRGATRDQALGVFDSVFGISSRVDYAVEELVGSRLRFEQDRRLRLEIPPPILDETAQKLIDRLPTDTSLLLPSSCAEATSFIFLGASSTLLCFDDDGNLLGLVDPSVSLDPTFFGSAGLAAGFAGLSGLNERVQVFVDLLTATAADQMRVVAFILRRTADSLRFQRIRLGDIPADAESIRLDLSFDHSYRFRNGSAFVSTLSLGSTEQNYRGKRLNPSLGDSPVANNFLVRAGLGLDLPLGRGGGRRSATAPLEASERAVSAAESLLGHSAADRARAALDAYWNLVAAQARVKYVGESLETQSRLLAATQELVDADVVARVELSRNRARVAQVATSLATAREARERAAAELIRTLGIEIAELDQIEVPSSFESWVDLDPLGDADPEALVRNALGARRDLNAASLATEANRILTDGARADLRPEVALSLNLSYGAFHETFRERFYDPQGFVNAFEDPFAGPSYGATVRVRWPFGNNAARGRLLQAESSTTSAEIDEIELGRTIRLRILELVAEARRTREELEARRANLEAIEATDQATMDRFRYGDLTVLDTLTTEEQLTQARLDLVTAEQAWLSIVTQLRFETGALVESEGGDPAAVAHLVPLEGPLG